MSIPNQARERAVELVAAGFDTADEIVSQIAEELADEAPEGTTDEQLQSLARAATTAAVEEHRRDQAMWPDVTDCDRLDDAFEALEREKIVARQNFTCCQTCGHAEIGEHMGHDDVGYVFFHMQDTESAVAGGGVYLAYGASADGEEATLDIARKIRAALEGEGLRVDWDGSVRKRIAVQVAWKRRRQH